MFFNCELRMRTCSKISEESYNARDELGGFICTIGDCTKGSRDFNLLKTTPRVELFTRKLGKYTFTKHFHTKFYAKRMQVFPQNRRYLAGHVTEIKISNRQKIVFRTIF